MTELTQWKITPDDPTPEMVLAGEKADWADGDVRGGIVNVWHLMHSTAPSIQIAATARAVRALLSFAEDIGGGSSFWEEVWPKHKESVEAFLLFTKSEYHPDDVAVDRFAAAMKKKLANARAKGRSGWDDPAKCTVEFLAELLVAHLSKGNEGNLEDVANLCMMLHQRKAPAKILADAVHHFWKTYRFTEEERKAIASAVAKIATPPEPNKETPHASGAFLQVFQAQLKSREQMKQEGQKAWWIDVAAGEIIQLRQATQSDLDRCFLPPTESQAPADYMCETTPKGALVAKAAISHMHPQPNIFCYVPAAAQ